MRGLLIFLMLSSGWEASESLLPQERLTRDILKKEGHTRFVRPVRNHSKPVNVKIRMNLYQLLEVNEPKQNVRLYVWMTQYWTDELLGWYPEEYGNISTTVLPHDAIWLPDTILYNSLQVNRVEAERWISVILKTRNVSKQSDFHKYPTDLSSEEEPGTVLSHQNGMVSDVIFQYPAIYAFTCKMNILRFPFDQQSCTLVFGSWTHDADGVDYYLYNEKVTFESFIENEEWSITEFTWNRKEVSYSCCPQHWTLLEAKLSMSRKPLYYITNLIIPTAIISIIAIFGFFMPGSTSGERTEKVNLGITTLLAMSILLLMVSDQMPTTSDYISIIGWYFLSIIFLISGGTFTTCVIIVVQKRAAYGRPLSKRARRIFFGVIAPVLCVSPPKGLQLHKLREKQRVKRKTEENGKENRSKDQSHEVSRLIEHSSLLSPQHVNENSDCCSNSSTPSNLLVRNRDRRIQMIRNSDVDWKEYCFAESDQGKDSSTSPDLSSATYRQFLRKMEATTTDIKEHLMEEKPESQLQIVLQWEYLASILDRLFLFIFLCGILLTTFGILSLGFLS